MDNQRLGGEVELCGLVDGERECLRDGQPVVILGRRIALTVEHAGGSGFEAPAILGGDTPSRSQ
jgi:hypothetical protein